MSVIARPPMVFHIDSLDLSMAPKSWAFAEERRGEIDVFFKQLLRDKPAIWNGRVLLMHRQRVTEGVFSGEFLETDYASFAAWTALGRPKADIHDCFGAAAVVSSDGALLLGEMGAHTYNAGRIYFPCGTPDPSDIIDGKVDLAASVVRELKEETGLDAAGFIAEPGWTTVVDGSRVAHIKVLRAAEDAETLRSRIREHLAREPQPELADIRIVRGPADIVSAMPGYVTAYLEARFKGDSP